MITRDEFKLFTKLVNDKGGICLRDTHMDLLCNRIQKRMLSTGAGSPYQYYRYIIEKGEEELLLLLDELTINETSFFRNRPQMDLLRYRVLPEIMNGKGTKGARSLRIWSAGCATGEEPYSIAMIVREVLDDLSPVYVQDVKIFASDISFSSLKAANRAVYDKDKIERIDDQRCITRYFDPVDDGYALKNVIREMVVFDYHNLKNDNGLEDLDIIFCRNVMIYFDIWEQERLVHKFIRSLREGGYLFVGHAETLQGMGTGMKFVCDAKGIAYRKPVSQDGPHAD